MSLYYETADLVGSLERYSGSLKSRVYNRPSIASSAQIYALIVETSNWSPVIKEVIDNAGILALEAKLTPILSLLLVHDLLFSKCGIAARQEHPLRLAVERHKARLRAELVKVQRVRYKCASLEELREKVKVVYQRTGSDWLQPRWVRANPLKRSLRDLLDGIFREYTAKPLIDVKSAEPTEKVLYLDENVPDLLALPPSSDLTKTDAYTKGEIILQDKASCFPAFLLLGSIPDGSKVCDVMDACAAPGNKTSHLAALLSIDSSHCLAIRKTSKVRIIANDRSKDRSKTLQQTLHRTGALCYVTSFPNKDFLSLEPDDPDHADVTAILLDPSCSGSGIVGREDMPVFVLPKDPREQLSNGQFSSSKPNSKASHKQTYSKKRRQPDLVNQPQNRRPLPIPPLQDQTMRLQGLSNLQTHMLEHAFKFPNVTHVTYSTCSTDYVENEGVALRALTSAVATQRGWRVLKREEQVEGMRNWEFRGIKSATESEKELDDEQLEACLRCWPDGHERVKGLGAVNGKGTMGFFVVGFVRDMQDSEKGDPIGLPSANNRTVGDFRGSDGGEDEWEGFVD